jgi:hypothetical protein
LEIRESYDDGPYPDALQVFQSQQDSFANAPHTPEQLGHWIEYWQRNFSGPGDYTVFLEDPTYQELLQEYDDSHHYPYPDPPIPATDGITDFDQYMFSKDKNDLFFRDPGNPPQRRSRRASRPGRRRPRSSRRRRAARASTRVTRNAIATSNVPLAQSSTFNNMSEPMVNFGTTSVRVKHREPIYEVDVGTTDAVLTLAYDGLFNPGFSCPWLRHLADMFEKYEIHSITFEYVPNLSYSNGGSITLAWDPDVDDKALVTVPEEVVALVPSVTGAVFAKKDLPISQTYLNAPRIKYIRHSNAAPSATFDLHMYDAGRLIMSGFYTAAQRVGKVFVTYDITLLNPHIVMDPSVYLSDKLVTTPGGLAAPFTTYAWSSGGTISGSNYSPTGWRRNSASALYCTVNSQWMIVMQTTGTVIVAEPTVAPGSGATIAAVTSAINAAQTSQIIVYVCTTPVTGSGYVTWDYTGAANTITAISVRICQYRVSYAKPEPPKDLPVIKALLPDVPSRREFVVGVDEKKTDSDLEFISVPKSAASFKMGGGSRFM